IAIAASRLGRHDILEAIHDRELQFDINDCLEETFASADEALGLLTRNLLLRYSESHSGKSPLLDEASPPQANVADEVRARETARTEFQRVLILPEVQLIGTESPCTQILDYRLVS